MKTKAARLRELISKGAVMMPGVPNASMARQVEQAGFDAIYVSGAGMINSTAGMPDIGLLSRDEVVRLARYVARGARIPAIVDADTGFGEGEEVAQTIRDLTIVDLSTMTARIKAAVAARKDKDFLIIARTDACAVEGFARAVERAGEYLAAGADAIFPEALQTAEEFRDFAKQIEQPLMANMTEFGKSPLLSFKQLQDFGYRMIIFPQSAFRISMKATEKFFAALKKAGTQNDWLEQMQTRQELYDLLEYDPAAEEWKGLHD
ncbi:MAG: methylisocitrate lyase [Verrucomicrobia bacterium]|nr:MAG: methylisocitrate lyase [Verrucomicrobiota bacterium]